MKKTIFRHELEKISGVEWKKFSDVEWKNYGRGAIHDCITVFMCGLLMSTRENVYINTSICAKKCVIFRHRLMSWFEIAQRHIVVRFEDVD